MKTFPHFMHTRWSKLSVMSAPERDGTFTSQSDSGRDVWQTITVMSAMTDGSSASRPKLCPGSSQLRQAGKLSGNMWITWIH